jgi:acetyl-CoA C-acetyltransferase
LICIVKVEEINMSHEVVIVSAARTPVGSFNGAFATLAAHNLGAVAIKAALERAGVEPGRVSEVIMGQVLTAAEGQNPARQASIAAGIPVESPASGINQLCGSGLRSVALGYQALLTGDSDIVVAGGQESMRAGLPKVDDRLASQMLRFDFGIVQELCHFLFSTPRETPLL